MWHMWMQKTHPVCLTAQHLSISSVEIYTSVIDPLRDTLQQQSNSHHAGEQAGLVFHTFGTS